MKITDISARRKGITLVVADGKEYLLNTDTVVAARIKKGDEISERELEELKSRSDCERARSRALWYLSRADHSKKALYDKLCRAYSPTAAQNAVERMEELGLINDLELAKRLAKYWSDGNVSAREIKRKLFAKGISRDIADIAVDCLESDPRAQIAALLSTKYKNRLTSEDGIKKVFAALQRKGFSYSDIRSALREYSENIDYSEEY